MKKTFKNLFFLCILFSGVTFSACSDDEESPKDIRDQAVGTYNYVLDFAFVDEEGDIIEISELSKTGTFMVKKNAKDNKMIDFFEDEKLEFCGSKIAEAANGFTFDVPTQILEDDDLGEITISGFNLFQLGNTTYNGFYDSTKKQISAAFQTILETSIDLGNGYVLSVNTPLIFGFEATKK